MNMFNGLPMYQIVGLWKAVAQMESCAARNSMFWACVRALENLGFAGNAREFLERAARWSR